MATNESYMANLVGYDEEKIMQYVTQILWIKIIKFKL